MVIRKIFTHKPFQKEISHCVCTQTDHLNDAFYKADDNVVLDNDRASVKDLSTKLL